MKKKKKEEGGGAPEWMVTFGDMMSLLLCFFVIIVSMSEVKEDEKYQKVKESIKKAFGYEGGIGQVPTHMMPTNSMLAQLQHLIMKKPQVNEGKSTDEGIEGENPSVKMVREGLEYTIGGQVGFETGRAVLLDGIKQQLDRFADVVKGTNHKIRVKGHTARIPAELYEPFKSLYDLSYARAKAVKAYLVSLGIREPRLTLEACADNEPLRSQAYDDQTRAENDRVSIIITDNLVDEYQGQPIEDESDLIDG